MTEFGFIDVVKSLCNGLPVNSFEGIGDDCAVLPISSSEALVFTSDMLIERVHFLREATSAYDLGRKSLTVNLSDVAAMGARPTATLLSLSIPKELTSGWIEEFMRGYTDLSRECGVALVGGDTTAAKSDLAINVTAIGRAPLSNIKRRSGAAIGDTIFVTAPLGGSGAGLADVLRGDYETAAARLHKLPTARIEEGVWLGGRSEVHSMMDISDGVASDLVHIVEASSKVSCRASSREGEQLGAEIELAQIPRHPSATLEQALCSGEDYELLFTATDSEELRGEYRAKFGKEIIPIGKIVAREGNEGNEPIIWKNHGAPTAGNFRGFAHY